jgi:putative RecB family exonuclease
MTTLHEYRKRPHWSYSSLNQLLSICSLQWFFERVERLESPFTPLPLAFGSVFHRTMEWIALQRIEDAVPPADEASELFAELWDRECTDVPDIQFSEKQSRETCAEQGKGMIGAYMNQIDPNEEVLEVSAPFVVPVRGTEIPLLGEIDCKVRAAGRDTIVDWKTSSRRWPAAQAHTSMQATAYLYGAAQVLDGYTPDFRFDVVVKNKTPVVETHTTQRGEDSFRRLESLVSKAEEVVKHGVFYPSDGSMYCGGCPFKDACKSWHRNRARTVSVAA